MSVPLGVTWSYDIWIKQTDFSETGDLANIKPLDLVDEVICMTALLVLLGQSPNVLDCNVLSPVL